MKKLTILIMSFTFLISCKKVEKPSVFINEWSSTKKPWRFGARLSIKNDGTFSYNGGACMETFNSDGKWKILNDTLVLTSGKIIDKDCADDFNNVCSKIGFVKPGDTTSSKIKCDKSRHFIIFKNEQFYIENDTLKHKPKSDTCGFKNDFVDCNGC